MAGVSAIVPGTANPADHDYDVVVVGAGPYGLSTAAHLLGRGLRVAIFGRPLELWRRHMPRGMFLRSHTWSTNLSDPRGRYTFERFCRESGQSARYPIPKDVFVAYGLWFQQHAVPQVDETYVSSIERSSDRFLVALQDGRAVTAASVVVALGVYYYAHRPAPFERLPADLVSHSSEHDDFRRFNGKTVVLIGAGQSAIESAALLQEAGARVHVVARRPIAWRDRDRSEERSVFERLMRPDASIAPGWVNWTFDHFPYLFYRFPQARKDSYNSNYSSGASHWLRDRVIGRVTLHENRTVEIVEALEHRLDIVLSDGVRLRADHVLLATGYQVDLHRLTMIHPALRAEIAADQSIPILNHRFESSVAGLYFVGLTSLRTLGPQYRFVAGCPATARRVARSVARRRLEPSRAISAFSLSTSQS